jgi:hypothetical protein
VNSKAATVLQEARNGQRVMRKERREESADQNQIRESGLALGVVNLRGDQAVEDRVRVDLHHMHIATEVNSVESDGDIIKADVTELRRATHDEIRANKLSVRGPWQSQLISTLRKPHDNGVGVPKPTAIEL